MTPHPAVAAQLPLDPAVTDATLAAIFGAQRPERDHASAWLHPQHEDGAMLIAALRPRDPIEDAYATRAAAAHYGSIECVRRAMLPDVPDNAAIRWHGKALALSRMNTDMVRMLKECQAAIPGAQPQPAGRPVMDQPADLDEVVRRDASPAAKPDGGQDPMSSERPSVTPSASASPPQPDAASAANQPGGRDHLHRERPSSTPSAPSSPPQAEAAPAANQSGGQEPMHRERPSFTPASPAIRTQLAAALAGKPVGMRDPMSSERPSFVPSACTLTTLPAAASFLSASPPRQSLRADLLGSTADIAGMLAAADVHGKLHVQ